MISRNPEEFVWTEISLTDCEFDHFHYVHNYWNSIRGQAFAPAWSDVDLLTLRFKVITHIAVVDVYDGLPYPYRFFGTSLTELHNLELTNKTTADIQPLGYKILCEEQYARIIETRTPILFVSTIKTHSGIIRQHHNFRFPLSGDGDNVTAVLTIENFNKNIDDMNDFYGKTVLKGPFIKRPF